MHPRPVRTSARLSQHLPRPDHNSCNKSQPLYEAQPCSKSTAPPPSGYPCHTLHYFQLARLEVSSGPPRCPRQLTSPTTNSCNVTREQTSFYLLTLAMDGLRLYLNSVGMQSPYRKAVTRVKTLESKSYLHREVFRRVWKHWGRLRAVSYPLRVGLGSPQCYEYC